MIDELQNVQKLLLHMALYFETNGKRQCDQCGPKKVTWVTTENCLQLAQYK